MRSKLQLTCSVNITVAPTVMNYSVASEKRGKKINIQRQVSNKAITLYVSFRAKSEQEELTNFKDRCFATRSKSIKVRLRDFDVSQVFINCNFI